ncbi:MAG: hypothetical protein ACI86M_001814, partial [Saprospiraceae bacterium]
LGAFSYKKANLLGAFSLQESHSLRRVFFTR